MGRKKKQEFDDIIKAKLFEDHRKEEKNGVKIAEKVFPPSNTPFMVYENLPELKKPNKFTEKGRRLLVAKYPESYKLYFVSYIDAGEKHFPRGGIKIYNATYDQIQYFYYESVMLHDNEKEIYKVSNIEN